MHTCADDMLSTKKKTKDVGEIPEGPPDVETHDVEPRECWEESEMHNDGCFKKGENQHLPILSSYMNDLYKRFKYDMKEHFL